MREVSKQIAAKNKRRAPEMTTKQGKLKADRKAKLQRIFLDDLASLENFSIVRLGIMTEHTFEFQLPVISES